MYFESSFVCSVASNHLRDEAAAVLKGRHSFVTVAPVASATPQVVRGNTTVAHTGTTGSSVIVYFSQCVTAG